MKTQSFFYLGLIAISLIACKNNENQVAAAPQAKSYPVIEVPVKTVIGYDEFPTTIQGKNNNEVRAKISGYITNVYVDEGDYVQKGQRLFSLETNTLNQEANAAKAGVRASDSQIEAADASIQTAKAAVDAAQVEVNKLIPLVEKGIISNVQLETAKANLNSAKSQLSQARAAKSQAQAGKGQAEANLNSIYANINYSVIRSPISGVVGKINQREGSLVGPTGTTPITTVSETGEVFAYFSMNESDYLDFLSQTEGSNLDQKLSNLPEVDLVLANGNTYEEKGNIETVTGQIDPQTGTVQFRASFNNKNKLLSNGNSGTIRIPKEYVNVAVVPEQATFEQQGIVYVYKVVQDTTLSTVVELTDRVNNMAIIASGVNQGDVVVANGVGNLRSGTAIQPQVVAIDSILQTLQPVFK